MATSIIGSIKHTLAQIANLRGRNLVRAARRMTWRRFPFSAAIVAGSLFGLIGLGSLDPAAAYQSSAAQNEVDLTSVTADDAAALDTMRPGGQPIDISFDDLKFDIEKGATYKPSMLTAAIKNLDGKQIRLRGYVKPGFKQSGIMNFVLVRDNQECCFGPGAALYDCVMVKMAEGQAIDFTVRPISLVGTLYLKEFIGKDKKVWAIYRMKDARQE